MTTSLLKAPRQGELFEAEAYASDLAQASRNPRFTAARFFQTDPKRYAAIVQLSAAFGSHDIKDMLGVSVHTVLAVQDREAPEVAQRKEELAERCLKGARLAVEEIISRLADPDMRAAVPPNCLGPWAGILIEKHELLTGGATSRISHVVETDDGDAYENFLATLQRAEVLSTGRERDGARTKEERTAPASGAAVEIQVAAEDLQAAGDQALRIACGSGQRLLLEGHFQ